uniref:Uncharacterized protein n=1 Tax=Arundo donax TaxID=35708 RepID=A0A0A9H545_ARUDO
MLMFRNHPHKLLYQPLTTETKEMTVQQVPVIVFKIFGHGSCYETSCLLFCCICVPVPFSCVHINVHIISCSYVLSMPLFGRMLTASYVMKLTHNFSVNLCLLVYD